jgi:putative acetyltransferase
VIPGLAIRPEAPGDIPIIHGVVQRAFTTQPHADGDEQDLVDRLRERGELTLSLVAALPDSGVVGHIGFSPVTIGGAECNWFQMAPVSVEPDLHHQGIGSMLIRAGLAELRERGAHGIAVIGNPAYYERFGFAKVSRFGPKGGEAIYFRAMVLAGEEPEGELRYASAFT